MLVKCGGSNQTIVKEKYIILIGGVSFKDLKSWQIKKRRITLQCLVQMSGSEVWLVIRSMSGSVQLEKLRFKSLIRITSFYFEKGFVVSFITGLKYIWHFL